MASWTVEPRAAPLISWISLVSIASCWGWVPDGVLNTTPVVTAPACLTDEGEAAAAPPVPASPPSAASPVPIRRIDVLIEPPSLAYGAAHAARRGGPRARSRPTPQGDCDMKIPFAGI